MIIMQQIRFRLVALPVLFGAVKGDAFSRSETRSDLQTRRERAVARRRLQSRDCRWGALTEDLRRTGGLRSYYAPVRDYPGLPGEFETHPGWVPTLDEATDTVHKLMMTKKCVGSNGDYSKPQSSKRIQGGEPNSNTLKTLDCKEPTRGERPEFR